MDSLRSIMTTAFHYLTCAVAVSLGLANPGIAQDSLVIADVTVIDATGAAPRPNSTVVLAGGRIVVIGDGRTPIPRRSRVVRAPGKFLIPGLWDMHTHLRENQLAMLVAHGVTGVRDMGNILSDVDRWRAETATGARVAPRIFRVGPVLNGQSFGPAHVAITNAAEARVAARVLKHVGVDALKTHRALSRDAYFALTDEAKRLGIRVVGHIPQTVTAAEASDAGQASFEHTETLFEGQEPLKQEEASELFARFVKNGNAYTPTLVAYRGSTEPANIDSALLRKYPDIVSGRRKLFGQFVTLVGLMNKAGVVLMTGSDLGARWISPGSALHEELALFVEAGLTPMEALQAATRNPARFLGIPAGTVEPSMLADLILLDANPLEDIRNSRRIHAVVLDGRYFEKAELDRLGAQVAP